MTPPLDSGSDYDWNFTVNAGGQQCLSYASSATGTTLTVGDQTVREDNTNGTTITCPDGSQVNDPLALDLLACFLYMPGTAWFSSDHSVQLSLSGGNVSDPVFDCSDPAQP